MLAIVIEPSRDTFLTLKQILKVTWLF